MIKHVILWKLKENIDKELIKKQIKEGLEGLNGVVPGLMECKVTIDCFDSSTADLMLETSFKNIDDFKVYANHPKHLAVANGIIKPNTEVRMAFDYELDER